MDSPCCEICDKCDVSTFAEEGGFKYLKCNTCGLIFRDKVDMAKMRTFYRDEGVTEDGELSGYYGEGIFRWRVALDQIQRYRKGGRLFEIGCGGGGVLREAEKRGFDVYGCDLSETRVRIINEILGRESLLCGDFENLEMADLGTYDVIVMMDVLSHFKSLNKAMEKVASLLNPGGILYLKGGNFGEFENFDEVKKEGIDLKIDIHFFHLTAENIDGLLRKHRLEPLRMEVLALHKFTGGYFGSDAKNYRFKPVSDLLGYLLYRLRIKKAAEVVAMARKAPAM